MYYFSPRILFISMGCEMGGDNTFEKAPPTHDLNVYSKHINIHTHTDICNLYLLYPSIRVCSRNFSQSISGKYLKKHPTPKTSAISGTVMSQKLACFCFQAPFFVAVEKWIPPDLLIQSVYYSLRMDMQENAR